MRGEILNVDGVARTGLIAAEDGLRYRFAAEDWKPGMLAKSGMKVDFVADGELAHDIFLLPGEAAAAAPLAVAQPVRQPGDNSVTLGIVGVACLGLAFVFPPLPLFGALIAGLIGAGQAKRSGNGTGLLLGRIAWIGSIVVGILFAALLTWAMIYAWPLVDLFLQYLWLSFATAAQNSQ